MYTHSIRLYSSMSNNRAPNLSGKWVKLTTPISDFVVVSYAELLKHAK